MQRMKGMWASRRVMRTWALSVTVLTTLGLAWALTGMLKVQASNSPDSIGYDAGSNVGLSVVILVFELLIAAFAIALVAWTAGRALLPLAVLHAGLALVCFVPAVAVVWFWLFPTDTGADYGPSSLYATGLMLSFASTAAAILRDRHLARRKAPDERPSRALDRG